MTKFTEDQLTVYYNNQPLTRLNGSLAERQGITEAQLERLKELHVQRYMVEKALAATEDRDTVKALFQEWTAIQFLLQEVWGFPKDANFHPSHRLSKCSCGATMDNDERLGTPYRVVTQGCPIHD